MLSTPLKALLGVLGAIVVVGGIGYLSGAFDRFVAQPPVQLAAVPPASAPEAKPAETQAQPASANSAAGTATQPAGATAEPYAAPAEPKPDAAAPSQPATIAPAQPAPAQAAIVPPTFDVLRVEADGSIVIAGKAPAGSTVEILAGSKVIGTAVANPEGDFAVVIDDPLSPGSYQIVLRATDEGNSVAMSTETAVVSIPERPDGQVLALVEQPGQPSKLITVPEPMTSTPAAPAAPAAAEADKPAETVAAADPKAPASDTAAAPAAAPAQPETKPAEPAAQPAAPAEVAVAKPETAPAAPGKGMMVEVKAIEIEGNKVFVAGVATPKKPVRAYANAIMLGETKSLETGEFLIEALVDLPVGDYIVRADLLADDGNKVLMRAQVPFRREAGEAISAVAPAAPPAAAPAATAEASAATAAAPSAAAPAGTSAATAPAADAPAAGTSAAGTSTAAAPAAAGAKAAAPAATAPATTAQAPAATAQASDGAAAPAAAASGTQVAAAPAPAAAVETAVPKPDLAMPTEPPSVTAAPLQPADGAVIIRRGDSLWRISRRVYGRGVRYSTIYLANQKQIADPDRIWPGQVFTVPVKTGTGESANMDAMGGQAVSPEDLAKYPPVR